MSAPEGTDRVITIEWDAPGAGQVIQGWRCVVRGKDGRPITTVTELIVHAPADGLIWAELTMVATKDGEPVLDPVLEGSQFKGVCFGDDGKPLIGTFPALIAGMTVRGAS